MMHRGLAYVAFGKDYDMQAAFSAKAARRYSDLPIFVITNQNNRHLLWETIDNVEFLKVDKPNEENRDYKTQLDCFTPFEETLYTDTDTAIQSKKYVEAFDILNVCDLAFPLHGVWQENEKVTRLYRMAMDKFHVQKPLPIYQGGVCVFKKNKATRTLFECWNRYWDAFGRGREMMCLACAAKTVSGVSIGMLSEEYGFPESKIIQHFYGAKAPKTALIPTIKKDKSFDKKYGKHRWDLVD